MYDKRDYIIKENKENERKIFEHTVTEDAPHNTTINKYSRKFQLVVIEVIL